MKQIKPGDKVTCDLHPEWGVGTASLVTKEKVFIVWGRFGKMLDRKYELCAHEHVRPAGSSQEKRRRFALQTS